jgi:hypothetical protein
VSRWTPCKRRAFIRRFRLLGFEGPLSGARHWFMIRDEYRLTVPSSAEYSVPQLRMMLQETAFILGREITLAEWEQLNHLLFQELIPRLFLPGMDCGIGFFSKQSSTP